MFINFGPKYCDVMIDLETMGTAPDAAIVSLGAVEMCFDENQLGDHFFGAISLASAMKANGTVEASTITWWLKQSEQARASITHGADLKETLIRFNRWLDYQGTHRTVRLWGNGATFDNVILRSAYAAVDVQPAWRFRGDMCYRTLKNIFSDVAPPERTGVHHNALDDALYQAEHMLCIVNALRHQEGV